MPIFSRAYRKKRDDIWLYPLKCVTLHHLNDIKLTENNEKSKKHAPHDGARDADLVGRGGLWQR